MLKVSKEFTKIAGLLRSYFQLGTGYAAACSPLDAGQTNAMADKQQILKTNDAGLLPHDAL